MKEDWTVLYCNSVDEMEELVFDKNFVWPLIMQAVREMIISGRTSIVVLEGKLINNVNGDSTVWITMSDSDVESSLEKGLKWREGREEYEECGKIVELLSDWRAKKMGCAIEA